MANGGGQILKAIVGGVLSLGVLGGIVTGIVANENRNVKSHTEMTADYINRDEHVLRVVTDIRVQQAVDGEILRRVEAKL